MGAVRAPSSWPCAGQELGVKRPVQGRPEVSPWGVPAAAGGSAVFPQGLCVSGPLLPPGGLALRLICSELSWVTVGHQQPCAPRVRGRRRTPVAALSVGSGATEVSLEAVALRGCTWIPVEQEGRRASLATIAAQMRTWRPREGTDLPEDGRVGGPSATAWPDRARCPAHSPSGAAASAAGTTPKGASVAGAACGRLW